ncbi:hypothetical protein EsDP_00007168 [Epichloe bromicola]|uniref:Uncharacterized protein n=1 Tax=Epichloe bromicola TaxID=79588 RepID=A0ABQ0CZS4_9HYPO
MRLSAELLFAFLDPDGQPRTSTYLYQMDMLLKLPTYWLQPGISEQSDFRADVPEFGSKHQTVNITTWT